MFIFRLQSTVVGLPVGGRGLQCEKPWSRDTRKWCFANVNLLCLSVVTAEHVHRFRPCSYFTVFGTVRHDDCRHKWRPLFISNHVWRCMNSCLSLRFQSAKAGKELESINWTCVHQYCLPKQIPIKRVTFEVVIFVACTWLLCRTKALDLPIGRDLWWKI